MELYTLMKFSTLSQRKREGGDKKLTSVWRWTTEKPQCHPL